MTTQVARVLTTAKQRSGLTFTELAERTGLARSSVERWLYGTRSPQIRDLYKLCAALGISPKDVFAEAEAAVRLRQQ